MPNHNYTTPEAGTLDWHVPLNENFRQLDRDVELRDVEGNLGDYDPMEGAKFLATDTGEIYIGDGSSWNRLSRPTDGGEAGGDPVSGQAETVYVGSLGDLQSEIDAMAEAGGGTVVLRRGSYDMSEPISLRSGVNVFGEGIGRTRIRQVAEFDSDGFGDPGDQDIEDVVVGRFEYDGNDVPGAGAIRIGVRTWPKRCIIERVLVHNCPQTGINIRRGQSCVIRNCYAHRCGGVSFNNALGSWNAIRNCHVYEPRQKHYTQPEGDRSFSHSLSIEKSFACEITDCIVEGVAASDRNVWQDRNTTGEGIPDDVTGHGLGINANMVQECVISDNVVRDVDQGFNAVKNAYRNNFSNNVFVDCIGHGMLLHAMNDMEPRDNVVADNTIVNCGDRGIDLRYAGRNSIRGNTVVGGATGLFSYSPVAPSTWQGNEIYGQSGQAVNLPTGVFLYNYVEGDVNVGDGEAHFNRVTGSLSAASASNNV